MKNILLLLVIGACFSCQKSTKQLDNVFYAFNNCVRTLPNAPEGFAAQAGLVKALGYDGLAGHMEENYFELRAAMDNIELEMPEMYIGLHVVDGEVRYHEKLRDILIDSKDRDLLVALHLHADVDDRNVTDSLLIEGIRDLADFAIPLNIKLSIYPHVDFYCEELSHAVSLVKAIDRKNVGAILNLCHLLKVEGEQGWKQKALDALPYLYMVSVNGTDGGETREMGWDRLIQPLGEGTFDTYELVKTLKDNGYEGKFGLQCYNIPQDCEKALAQSMRTWRSYQERYARE